MNLKKNSMNQKRNKKDADQIVKRHVLGLDLKNRENSTINRKNQLKMKHIRGVPKRKNDEDDVEDQKTETENITINNHVNPIKIQEDNHNLKTGAK